MGMAVSNREMQWTAINDRFCEILGYSSEEILGRKITDFVHPDDLEVLRGSYTHLATGDPDHYTSERRYIRKDGNVVHLTVFAKAFRSKEGTADHYLALIEDITERKQAQDALRQSHDELRAIYEGMFDGFVIMDVASKRFSKINPSFCRMLGYSEAELLAMTIRDIHPPEDVAEILRRIKARADGQEEGHINIPFLRKDGSVFLANIVSSSITYGGRRCFAAFIHDVTEEARAEEALRQSYDELRTIYEEMADGIIIVTIENPHSLRANAAICRMSGYSEEEMRTILPARVHPPEVLPIVQEHLESLKQHGVVRIAGFPFLRKDGKLVYADVVVSQIAYDGQLCGISFLHDVTERKQAEEALQKEHRTLKHLLQSSDHERQTIAYEIHDGLAQYLAGAIMQFDVYKHQLEKKPNDAAKAYDAAMTLLRQGHSEARRLIAGIRHPVLDEAGVIEAVAHLINEQNREKGPKIEFHSLVDFSRLVPLLENAIYRIIQEGMTNACKYSQSSRVRITLLQQKDRLRIEIRDWGIGFDTKNAKEGSYGLTGIRERARLLGGKYRLSSAAGKGTRIVAELPLMERER